MRFYKERLFTMKKCQRITLLLALVLLISAVFTACTQQEEEKRKIWWELGTEGRAATPDNLPEDLNYDGYEVIAYHRGGLTDEAAGFDGENADPVQVVVYERNRKIEQRLNVKLTWYASDGVNKTTADEINKILQTNQYYDFILTTNNTIVNYKKNSYLCELTDSRYLDFNQPWWWIEYMDEIAFDGVTYNFMVGDINISNFKKLSAMYVNFGLSEEILKMNSKDFYKMVNDKEWTIETFYALTKQCYRDTDKNPLYSGKPDQDDTFGFAWSGAETIQQMIFSTSIVDDLYERREGQFNVTLNLINNPDIQELCEQLTNLIHNNPGAWDRRINNEASSDFDGKIINEFAHKNYVFLAQRLTAACSSYLRSTSVNFGILPYPTLYKGDDYVSYGETSATCICIPLVVKTKSNKELDRAGAVLEALCAESYRYTIDAFYKDALQTRYTRDPESVDMIDIIYESRNKNFLIEYNSAAGSILNKIYYSIRDQQNIESMFASAAPQAQSALNNYINELLDLRRA